MIDMNKKYKTRDGRSVRILCTDGTKPEYPIIGCFETGEPSMWTRSGFYHNSFTKSSNDLVEYSPFEGYKIDDKIMVRDHEREPWVRRYFAGVSVRGNVLAFCDGATSWSARWPSLDPLDRVREWNFCRKPEPHEL